MNKHLQHWLLSLVLLISPALLSAQDDAWEMPRTKWGDPLLQGYWTNSTMVPLQRPENLGTKTFFSLEEYQENLRAEFEDEYGETQAGTAADVHYQFDDYAMNKTADTITENLRTSIITEPANGRYPELTEAAITGREEYTAFRRDHQWERAQNRTLSERCLIWDQEGPPILPLGYNSTHQFLQTQDYVILLHEMIHDARIIPLDGGDPAENALPQWLGNSRGHWEGNTLVVETTGYSGRTNTPGLRGVPMSTNAKVTERFTRVGDTEIQYEFTVTDPAVWKQSWSGSYPFNSIEGPMFEYACHEGNYGIVNILSGKRVEELDAYNAANE